MKAPLFEALVEYSHKNKIPFHMPGHKQGKGIFENYKTDLFRIDVTELPDTDNLHFPEGVIDEAQKLLASAYGALSSFFLVNGSTCGIQAMIATVCNPGDILIVDRNCHSSVISALILSGVIPKYVYPEYISKLGFMGGIAPEEIKKAFIRFPEAKGVLITSPNYYGICLDIESIADIVHSFNKVLLVDEAHGAHFYFHEKLPKGAIQCGADICVQSAHKTLPALTQSSMLHVGSNRISLSRLKKCLRLFQSSSPSFILMAYLDVARNIMVESGKQIFDSLLEYSHALMQYINNNTNARCPLQQLVGQHAVHEVDVTRLVINFSDYSISGYEVAAILNEQYNIQVEMADFNNIVCIPSVGNSACDFQALGFAVGELLKKVNVQFQHKRVHSYPRNPSAVSPREAFYSNGKVAGLLDSVGRISCDTIVCYPPGVPILCPGETISRETVDYILDIKRMGGKIMGLSEFEGIRVVV